MPLASGTKLGPYEIVAPLGAGGMGEVYRARDLKLDREVALKALPEAFAGDLERIVRFEREAKVLASLQHPRIAAIYGLHEHGSTRFLAMELVPGEDLAQRLARGPLAVDEALRVATGIAEALEAAHEQGIIHRDLKPANVQLAPDGAVKVLDFGLAKALQPAPSSATSLSQSPTLTTPATMVGVILGTAAYMSPEQARGVASVDRRADIWAFGCVLYEMLTARRAFEGDTVTETIASVLRSEPEWEPLLARAPQALVDLVQRCLRKDPKRRIQSIGDVRVELEDMLAQPVQSRSTTRGPAASTSRRPLQWLPWLITALSLIASAVLLAPGRRKPASMTELSIVPQAQQQIGEDLGYQPMAISPDGSMIAYTVRVEGLLRLRLRHMDRREDVEIAGAIGARNLFFSPDSQWIGFFDSRKMYKVSVRGGTPIELADTLQDRLGTWLDDGTIVYSREVTQPLFRIPEGGGEPVAVTELDSTQRERTHRFPCALDGGPWVVFTAQTVESPGGYDDANIDAVSVTTGERRHLFAGARRAVWAPGGYLILARGSDLYATPVDPRDPRITQDPVPVLADVSGDVSSGASYFSLAKDGTLAWIPGGEPERTREIGWFDREGRWTPIPIPAGPYAALYLGPGGSRALISAGAGGGATDLWLADLRNGQLSPLTHGNRGGSADWLPDGIRMVYSRSESGLGEAVFARRIDGTGGETLLGHALHPLLITDVTPDGLHVVYSDYGQRQGRIHLAPVDASSPPRALPGEGDGYEQAGYVSPDGLWLAYVSNKSRREEVCVRRLDGSSGSWQLSNGTAGGIRWGRDGRELFFVTGEVLTRVPLHMQGTELVAGPAEPLFDVPPSPTETSFRDYDYDPIGDRFLFTRPPRGVGERREIAISIAWTRGLVKLLN